MKNEKKLENPTYEILENFNGQKGEFKSFIFEKGKQTDKTCLILTGWDNRNINFMLDSGMIKKCEKKKEKFIDVDLIKKILFSPSKDKEEGLTIKKDKIKDQFKYNFSTLSCAENFLNKCPMFYDESKYWWLWDEEKKFWKIVDDIELFKNYLNTSGDVEITQSKHKSEIEISLKLVGRDRKPKLL